MVQNKEIASLNLKGNLTLKLNAENMNDLSGTKVTLKDGNKEIASNVINGQELTFTNVPNGVYSLAFTGEKMSNYIPDEFYVYIKENQNEAVVSLEKINVSDLANQSIRFLGLGDSELRYF